MGETLQSLFIGAVILLAAGGIIPLLSPRNKILASSSFISAFFAGLLLAAFSIWMLCSGSQLRLDLTTGLFPIESPSFYIDALSSFFCLILSILLTAISLYSIRYADYYSGTPVGILSGFYNFIALSMLLVFTSDNSFQFLVAWEAMTLFAFFLVMYEYKKEQSVRAGSYYITMTHFGTLFLIAMFLLMYKFSGSPLLSGVAASAGKFPRWALNFIFIAALIGFGTKAGIVPMHIWLPLAHPVAPSNVSALMSGMLIKTGIYGLMRFFLIFNNSTEVWWGVLVLVVASISALLGVMYALMEHDLKRLLAYHSIENIGIILIGLAMSMLFSHFKMPALAGFALTASLFHTLNHAVFKGLLFLGAGAVHFSVHDRDMEKLGGLIKLMPWTAIAFLIGALSISAVPPFNGFVSEWMTFVSIIQVYLIESAPEAIRITVPIAGAMLALTGALAAACFVKVFGITFLGVPRSEQTGRAQEVPVLMRLPQVILALVCMVTGIFPFLIVKGTEAIRTSFFGADALVTVAPDLLSAPGGAGSISTFYVFASLLFFIGFGVGMTRLFGKGKKSEAETWACGGVVGGREQYTATGFSKPIRLIFSALYQPKKDIVIDPGENIYQIRSIKYYGKTQNIFEMHLYKPLIRLVIRLSEKVWLMQERDINVYLGYIFVLFILMLLFGGAG